MKFRSRHIALTILCLGAMTLLSFSAQAQTRPDDWDARMEKASVLHDIIPVKHQFEHALAVSLSDVPPTQKSKVADTLRKRIDMDDLERIAEESMAELFTPEEMDAMIAYFGSSEAALIAQKMPVYERAVQAAIQKSIDLHQSDAN